jgi:AAHS family benzoate transporter-like MFS transporter
MSWLTVRVAWACRSAVIFLLVCDVGATYGLVGVSYFVDKFESRRVVILAFLIAAAAVASLSIPPPMIGLYALLIVAGATALGTQALFINARSRRRRLPKCV